MTFPARLANFLYRFRLALSGVILVGVVAFAPSANFTRIENDLNAWLAKDDPAYQEYERFRVEFGGTRSLIIALRTDRLFSPEVLLYIDRVSADLMRVPYVERVQSLATANVVRPVPPTPDDDGGIEVRPLLEDRAGSIDGAAEVRREALADPLLRGDLVSEDGRVTAILVTFDEDHIDDVRGRVLTDIRDYVSKGLPAGVEVHYNGNVEISETYNRVTIANARDLTPPILILTAGALYWMFRSVRRTLLILLAIGASVVWTLGIYSAMGFSFNILTSMLTPFVVVLAISDDVHIVQHFDEVLRATGSKERAFKASISHLFAPLLGASGSTALGMLSLATSDIVAVRTFGYGAAIGVMVDFAMSLVLVPTMLTLMRPETSAPPQERWLKEPLRRVGRFAFSHAGLVIAATVALTVVAVVGITRLRVDTNHINFFAETHPLAQSAALIDRDLAGIYSFNVLLEGPPDSIATPDTLARMDRLSRELEALPHIRKVSSVADYVKRVNQQLLGGAQDEYRLPETKEAIAQELFVFGLSDEGRSELSRVVTSDYSRAHLFVKLASLSSDQVFEQIRQAERLASVAFAGSDVKPTVTGSGRIFAALDNYLVNSQLSSFATAFITVFAVIFVVFRSTRFGLLGVITNSIPVVVVLGLMGWLDISLNVGTVMVASLALGIVDDDTIHFIGRYRREVAGGASTIDAVELASMHEGRAALTTTVVNSLGYTVLIMSEYRPSSWFGLLLATTMTLAFITELLLVPAIIAIAPRIYGAPAVVRRLRSVA